jgi:hypothetical protein
MDNKWSLENLPKKGDKAVPGFFYNLFEMAKVEKERLHKNADFLANYCLYRGKTQDGTQVENKNPCNLYFANVERSVATITSRNPVGEVVDLDGLGDGVEKVLTAYLVKWWKDTGQKEKTTESGRAMEIYGITPEKPFWSKKKQMADIRITDPFSFFPAPGRYKNMEEDIPYGCFVYLDSVTKVEADYNVEGVAEEDGYDLLGSIREEQETASYAESYRYRNEGVSGRTAGTGVEKTTDSLKRCLKIEVWVRDKSTKTVTTENPVLTDGIPEIDEAGNPVLEKTTQKVPVYSDGVRIVLLVKSKDSDSGYMVLEDCANPNINPVMDTKLAKNTYPWGRFPMYAATSYDDMVTGWGFAAAEQVGDLIEKINLIIIKLMSYVINVMDPPLIVQKYCGISIEHIETAINKGGKLVLMPTIPNARIEFMPIPDLPATFFNVLDLLVRFFDRVYAMEEADRGQVPKGITGVGAIRALQDRNKVLMQPKIMAMDYLAEHRSKWAIGLLQNFGTKQEFVEVADQTIPFEGSSFADRHFNYVIEAGSSMPRTSLAMEELAERLYDKNAIDRQLLLEIVKIPGGLECIERIGESQLDAALQVLISAGLEEEEAAQLRQFLMEPGQNKAKGKNTESKETKPEPEQRI